MVEYLQADTLKNDVTKSNGLDMEVIVHESVDSTNSWSQRQCKIGRILPFACFAENQTSGRGRRGKQWAMSAYSNIAMSISWPYVLSHQLLHLMPLSIAMAVVRVLEELNFGHVQIKWPNDIYVHGRKIAGILIETQPIKQKLFADNVIVDGFKNKEQTAVVIGVGLNYDISSLRRSRDLDRIQAISGSTDIVQEIHEQNVGQVIERSMVASLLLQHVVTACQNYQLDSSHNLERFRARYDFCKNKMVKVTLDTHEVLSGVAQGVNDRAELVVIIDGEERAFNSAEVSVRAEPQ